MKSSLAKRYAQALLSYIENQPTAKQVEQNMQHFVKQYQKCPQLITFLRNPTISIAQKINLINQHITQEYHQTAKHFLQFVIQKKRGPYLHKIVEGFLEEYQRHQKSQTGYIIAAHPITESTIKKLTQIAQKTFHKHQLQLKVNIQPDILGGYILQVGNYRLDASIQGKLHELLQYWQKPSNGSY